MQIVASKGISAKINFTLHCCKSSLRTWQIILFTFCLIVFYVHTLAAYAMTTALARFAHFRNFFIVFSQIYGEDVKFSKWPNWVLRKYRFSELNGLARAQKSSRQYWLFYAKNVAFFNFRDVVTLVIYSVQHCGHWARLIIGFSSINLRKFGERMPAPADH